MLQRKAMERFERWREAKTRQALLVLGARQVGKTFLIREFAKRNYQSTVEFNLVANPEVLAAFKGAANASDLALRMTAVSPAPMVPGKTLVFIDEVQECLEIMTYIKFLVDKGDYDYVLSGSLLGVELENIRSYPIGYVTEVMMYPLDFEEFCWADGLGTEPHSIAQDAFVNRNPIPDYLHDRLLGLFHRYLVIGGMPDAVVSFKELQNIDQIRTVQDGIISYYARDITKYAPKERRLVIRNIFDLIPSELSSQNRRFNLSSIKDVKRYTQIQDEFLWLTKANVALPAFNVKAPVSPLLINESHNLFKLFLSDVGLLASRYSKQMAIGLLDGRPYSNLGGIYENFVAQELAAHGFALRYFKSKRIGELDFVLEDKAGLIIAIEVKSGKSYRTHAALTNALAVPNYTIDTAYVLAETNIENRGEVCYLPIYLAGMLQNE